MTDAGVQKLQQALPNCRIYHEAAADSHVRDAKNVGIPLSPRRAPALDLQREAGYHGDMARAPRGRT